MLTDATALALNIALNSRCLKLSYLSRATSPSMGTLCMPVLSWAIEAHSFLPPVVGNQDMEDLHASLRSWDLS